MTWFKKGQSFYASGKYKEAIEAYTRTIELDLKYAAAYYNRGLTYDNLGEYQLAIGQGRSIDGPYTQNNYVWMQVDDWPHWERTIMQGPFIHHTGMMYGHYGDVLVEACKYIPGLAPLRLDRSCH